MHAENSAKNQMMLGHLTKDSDDPKNMLPEAANVEV
jgi:hypothetical protein